LAEELLKRAGWLDQALGFRLNQLPAELRERLLAGIPDAVSLVARLLASRMEDIVQALGLPRLVDEQVRAFPVEKLEQIILHVTGKELKAITWLGCLLGGIIGFVQALFMLWFA
jgi:uncharacterized membrane protein YheB (UPF0754 family)